MTFALTISCDAPGCDATATVTDDEITPVCSENLSGGRAHFVVDTSWLDMPTGWQFGDVGVLCPTHAVAIEGG